MRLLKVKVLLMASYILRVRRINRLVRIAVSAVLMITIASPFLSSSQTALALSGTGNGLNPYQINSCSDFKQIASDLTASYILNQSINCTSDANSIMIPRGFSGTFSGSGNTMTVAIDSSANEVGLFGYLDGATISKFTLAGSVQASNNMSTVVGSLAGYITNSAISQVTINSSTTLNYTSGGNAGGMAANMSNSTVDNSAVTGTVTSDDPIVGGMFGQVSCGIHIANSHTSNDVIANGSYAGGMVAADGCQGPSTTYTDVYTTGNVSADGHYTGGLIGFSNGTTITNAYATGNIEGIDVVGGLIGDANAGTLIQRSYASGDILGFGENSGGLIGTLENGSSVDESFAKGTITGTTTAGGLVGLLDASSIDNSYARGNVSGADIGGLVGSVDNAAIHTSYATGQVDLTNPLYGGMVGKHNNGTSDSSFWDKQSSGLIGSAIGAGKTTTQMKSLATYTSSSTPGIGTIWDFSGTPGNDSGQNDYWSIQTSVNNGYPCLMWVSGCVAPLVSPSTPGSSTPPVVSSDTDGIASVIEDAAPNNGDANNDGTLDSLQSNVASFINPQTGNYAALAVSSACTITSVAGENTTTYFGRDSGYTYPYGMLNFSISCATPGYSATISHYYYGVPSGTYTVRKYNATNRSFSSITGAAASQVSIAGQLVIQASYTVVDGGVNDDDGVANGIILDPAGLGLSAVGVPNTGFSARN